MRKIIEDFEKATLLLYIVKNGLPPWDVNGVKTLALLSNLTEKQAEKAFERAHNAGYLDKR